MRFEARSFRGNTGLHRGSGRTRAAPSHVGGRKDKAITQRSFASFVSYALFVSHALIERCDTESFRQQFVRSPSRGMIVGHGGDHQFIRACRFDQRHQSTLNRIDAADHEPLAMAGNPDSDRLAYKDRRRLPLAKRAADIRPWRGARSGGQHWRLPARLRHRCQRRSLPWREWRRARARFPTSLKCSR